MRLKIIEQIHASPTACVIAAAGGGASAITDLLAVPGASRTLLAAHIPYAAAAMKDYLGHQPEQASSSKTARELAMKAWQEARMLSPSPSTVVGIGCTAALATDRERRGADRCFIAVQSLGFTRELVITFDKRAHTRAAEEQICADLLITELASVAGIEHSKTTIAPLDHLARAEQRAELNWQQLMTGEHSTSEEIQPAVLFPGAFHPMHHGHVSMAEHAALKLGSQPTLEISVINVDKAPIDYLEMASRLDSVEHKYKLVFTRAPTFAEKAKLFPGTTFVVGIDTVTRIADARYYNHSIAERDQALQSFHDHGVRFLVFGRQSEDTFITLDSVTLPPTLAVLCTGVSEAEFREDISSTHLRTSSEEE